MIKWMPKINRLMFAFGLILFIGGMFIAAEGDSLAVVPTLLGGFLIGAGSSGNWGEDD